MDYDKVTGHYRLADDFSGEVRLLSLQSGYSGADRVDDTSGAS